MEAPGRMTKSACLAFMAKVTMFNGFSDENGIPCGVSNSDQMRKVVEYCEQIKDIHWMKICVWHLLSLNKWIRKK